MSDSAVEPPVDPSDEHPNEASDIAMSDAAYVAFSGFCMGTADVVPGVSGGTMAVALGIYEKLLAAITSIDASALKSLVRFKFGEVFARVHWRFLVALFSGVVVALVLMVKVVKLPHMILPASPSRPFVYAIFFGMVLGSAVVIARQVKSWSALRYALVVAGAAIGFAVVNLVPVQTPEHPVFIFFCGAVAICAMLLPGISGSFILLILGKYAYVLGALSKLKLSVILPFVAGCAFGLLAFSRLLKWLLKKFHDSTMSVLIGLLIGSLWRIWPYQKLEQIIVREKPRVIGATPFLPHSVDMKLLFGFLGGIAFVIGLEWYASRRRANLAAASTI